MTSSMGATFAKQPDASVLVEGTNGKGTYTITLADRPDRALPRSGSSCWPTPSCPPADPAARPTATWSSRKSRPRRRPRPIRRSRCRVTFGRATADFARKDFRWAMPWIAATENRLGRRSAVRQGSRGHVRNARRRRSSRAARSSSSRINHQYDDVHTIGKFRIAVDRGQAAAQLSGRCRPTSPRFWPSPPSQRTDAQKAELAGYYRVARRRLGPPERSRGRRGRAAKEPPPDRRTRSGLGPDQQPVISVQSVVDCRLPGRTARIRACRQARPEAVGLDSGSAWIRERPSRAAGRESER